MPYLPGCLYAIFARLSVSTDSPGRLYVQICQVVCMHRFSRLSVCHICQIVCMYRFARLYVCTYLPGCMYAHICQVVYMLRFARLYRCTDLPGCMYAQICPVVCMNRIASARQCDKYQTQIIRGSVKNN